MKWTTVNYGFLKPSVRQDLLIDSTEDSIDHDTIVIIPKGSMKELCGQD